MLVLGFTACFDEPYQIYTSKATLSSTIATYHATTLTGQTSGDPSYMWVAQVVKGKEFCSLVKSYGVVGENFQIKFDLNNSLEERTAEVKITYTDNYSKTFTIRQWAKTEDPEYDKAWGEQPAFSQGAALLHKTYYTTLTNGKSARNYSICYDTDKLVSHWVAYPVHDCYLGDSGRTNEWSFDDYYYTDSGSVTYTPTDPVIPQSQQQNIAEGGYQGNGDRGHMLPSASRLYNYNTNAQTFYATNMMPQYGRFNQGVWADLEGLVRGWRCSDTLFVVTGTLFKEGSYQFTARGRKITSPSHCYKLVLRTKSGKSGKYISEITSASELKAIAFLFKNNSTGAATAIEDAAVPIAEIEQLSGFEFFRNLNPAIADEVKQQKNLKDWGL